MRNFQEKRVWRNIMQSTPVLVILGIVIIIFGWSVLRFWNKMTETSRNKEIVEERVISLQEKKQKLIEDIDNLNTDEGKERVFRENFGLAKEGEEMIIVVEDKKQIEPEKTSSFSGFFSFFKNLFK